MSNGGFDDIHQKLLTRSKHACGGERRVRIARAVAAAGDSALLVAEFPAASTPRSTRARAGAAAGSAGGGADPARCRGGYCTVTVYFDPSEVDAPWLESRSGRLPGQSSRAGPARLVDVPVCYGGDFAPDLADVAAFGGCSTTRSWLSPRRTYRVYMVGFIPGFAYLAEVDSRIAAPRRATPRSAVPAARSPSRAARPASIRRRRRLEHHRSHRAQALRSERPDPFLFDVGDQVRFRAIGRAEFEQRPRRLTLTVVRPRDVHDRAGSRAMGTSANGVPVAGPMDIVFASSGQPARWQRRRRGARDHAGRAGARTPTAMVPVRGRRRRVRGLVGGTAVGQPGRFDVPASADGSAKACRARAQRSRSVEVSTCRPCWRRPPA